MTEMQKVVAEFQRVRTLATKAGEVCQLLMLANLSLVFFPESDQRFSNAKLLSEKQYSGFNSHKVPFPPPKFIQTLINPEHLCSFLDIWLSWNVINIKKWKIDCFTVVLSAYLYL